jgi:hypothetical protein
MGGTNAAHAELHPAGGAGIMIPLDQLHLTRRTSRHR